MAYMNSEYGYPPAWDLPDEEDEVEQEEWVDESDEEDEVEQEEWVDESDEEFIEDNHSESLWEQRK